MSTATVIESFDTQMLDYPVDLDVPMHAETWHINTPMDADSPHLRPQSTTVEVEMEQFDNVYEEYEMGDDQDADKENYNPHNAELLDVEVYDVSQAQTPRPEPDIELPPASLETIAESSIPVFVQSEGALPILSPVNHTPLSEIPAESLDSYNLPSTVLSSRHPSAQDAMFRRDSESSAANYFSPASESTSWKVVPSSDNSVPVAERTHVEADDVEARPIETSHEVGQQENLASGAEIAHAPEPDDSARQNPDETDPEQHHDPHEISEGIYIDPPPAVLLSLPSSTSEEPQFSLFNQPEAGSRASSPSQGNHAQAWILLLHHRPTLYYEPLAHLFEALRQDAEFVARVPELAEGALILDAYDLQLIIYEDDIHTHEITLHDLNVIHDGIGFSGPFRVQMRTMVPRFITRYRLLQEQLARVNVEDIDAGELGSEGKVPYHDEAGEPTGAEHLEHNRESDAQQEPEEQDESSHHDDSKLGERPQRDLEEDEQAPDSTDDREQQSSSDDHPLPTANSEKNRPDTDEAIIALAGSATVDRLPNDEKNEDPNVGAESRADLSRRTSPDPQHASYQAEEQIRASHDADDIGKAENSHALERADEDEEHTESPVDVDTLREHKEDANNRDPDAPDAVGPSDDLYDDDDDSGHHEVDSHNYDENFPSIDTPSVPMPNLIGENDQQGLQVPASNKSSETHEDLTEYPPDDSAFVTADGDGQDDFDQSDADFLASLENGVDPNDPQNITLVSRSSVEHPTQDEPAVKSPELAADEQEWDGDLDAEGELDPDTIWEAQEPDFDAGSNESSVTLSSTKTASKRTYDEVDEDINNALPISGSPDSKRLRFQG